MEERDHLIALSAVPGIGPVRCRRLLAAFGSAIAAWHASPLELAAAGLEARLIEKLAAQRARQSPAALRERLQQGEVATVVLGEPDYPVRLTEIPDAPVVLYRRGQLASIDAQAVAIVGTRRATAAGREMARRLASGLAEAGLTVVSGLALGIDAVAHEACLAAGGRTLAVLASGPDIIYPAEHRSLATWIAEHGALLSEYPPGLPPDAPHFPARNRLISGLALGVIVIEAGQRSGALITAGFAGDQGREVMAVPGSVLSGASDGCHALIRDGATLVTTVADVLAALPLVVPGSPARADDRSSMLPSKNDHGPATRRLPLGDSAAEQRLLDRLAGEATAVDDLVRASGLPIGVVNATLTMLEIKGLVRRVATQVYSLT